MAGIAKDSGVLGLTHSSIWRHCGVSKTCEDCDVAVMPEPHPLRERASVFRLVHIIAGRDRKCFT